VKNEKKQAEVSTVVCNHIGWQDIFNLQMSSLHPSYLAKEGARNITFISLIMNALQCIYVNRGGTEKERD
jgi:1-acyl-sn-glycerol-3-phosphate acyltransferase